MAVKFSNNAVTTLSSAITASATTIAVADASSFPTLGSGDFTYVTIDADSATPKREVVKVTAISSNNLTVVRGQDDTTASSFDAGVKVELRLTAALLNSVSDEASVTNWSDVAGKPDPTITLSGDVSGSGTMTDVGDVTITTVVADDSHNHTVGNVDGLQAALDGKVDDSQVLTDVPSGAVFTDTTYTVGDGGLTQKNFTTTLKTKLDGIANNANNYVLPFTDNSSNWNTAYSWGDHSTAGYLTSFTETDPTVPSHVKNITSGNISNWNTAYGRDSLSDFTNDMWEVTTTVPTSGTGKPSGYVWYVV